MTTTRAGAVLKRIRELVTPADADRLTDHDLLHRFRATREPAAFEALLRRYGGLVLSVCRRVLANRQDAEDAFQATFLVLAQSAGSIRKGASLASWLYGVAYRVAAKARLRSARRRRHEARAAARTAADTLTDLTGRELVGVLDEELGRLAERLRAPLVLCYLEGKTRDEAARELGWSLSTLQRRLEEGRERLRGRLARRGLALPTVLLAAGVANGVSAAVPARLGAPTLRAALEAASGTAAPAGVSAAVASLARGAARAAPTRLAAAAVLVIGVAGLALALASGRAAARPGDPGKQPATKPAPAGAMPKVAGSKPSAGGPAPAGKRAELLSVSGRVSSADGKAGIQADVILVGSGQGNGRVPSLHTEVLARGRTDREGRYRLTVKKVRPGGFEGLYVLAEAKGCGLGCVQVAREGGPQVAHVRLRPERPLSITLIDLQGQPAAGVKVRVHSMADEPGDPRMALLGRKGAYLMDARNLSGYEVRHDRTWGFAFTPGSALRDFAFWPAGPLTTDARGRFVLRGFGEGQVARLLVEDDRFAAQELRIRIEAGAAARGLTLPLSPARWLEGRVLAEDTGRPLTGVELVAQTTSDRGMTLEQLLDYKISLSFDLTPLDHTTTRTDAEGRYRLRLAPGDTVGLRVFAPDGSAYLGIEKRVKLAPGTVRRTLPLTLPRGVEVRGRVTEQASGKPVAGAQLYFLPQRDNNPRYRRDFLVGEGFPTHSRPDGSYRIVVPTQPGHLLVTRTGQGFIERPVTRGELYTGKPVAGCRFDGLPGAEPIYFHAIHRLDLAPQAGVKELPVRVRRGVTLRGRVVGPDGEAVPRAFLFCGGALLAAQQNAVRASYLPGDLGRVVPVHGGEFELRGCDPDKTYCVYFLSAPRKPARDGDKDYSNEPQTDPAPRLGAAVKLSAASAGGKPVTVRLQPCGAVEFRALDRRDRPLRRVPESPGSWKTQFMTEDGQRLDQQPYLDLLIEPRRGALGEERLFLGFPFNSGGYQSPFGTDRDGRVRLTGLIPGAEYRLMIVDEAATDSQGYPPEWGRSFSVEAGQTRRLPDLVLPLALGKRR